VLQTLASADKIVSVVD